jgi:hypothetical protein
LHFDQFFPLIILFVKCEKPPDPSPFSCAPPSKKPGYGPAVSRHFTKHLFRLLLTSMCTTFNVPEFNYISVIFDITPLSGLSVIGITFSVIRQFPEMVSYAKYMLKR